MKNLFLVVSITVLMFNTRSFSQSHDLGKVIVAELQEKRYQKDTTAEKAHLSIKNKALAKCMNILLK
jgi:hypothetical protein